MVPNTMPPMVATMVSQMEKMKPLMTKGASTSQLNKERSRLPMSVASHSACGDEARHARPLLDEGHDAVHCECRNGVQHGNGQVHLYRRGGLLAGLAGEEREFRNRHREGHRGILDDVHRLAG